MNVLRITFRHLSIALGTTALFACAPSSSNTNPVDPTPSEKVIDGDLVKNYSELIALPDIGKCDQANTDLRIKIARSLDDRTAAIKQASIEKYGKDDPSWTTTKVGPETFITLAPAPLAPDAWTLDVASWVDIEKLYAKLDANSPIEHWMALNSYVRSVLVNDRNRLVHNESYAYHHDDGPALDEAYAALQACQLDTTCVSPALSPAAKALTDRIRYFRYYLNQASDPLISNETKRKSLDKMVGWMKFDLGDKFNGWVTPAVSRTGDHELTVQLNVGVFKGVETLVSAILEKTWQLGDDKVRIAWQEETPSAKAFTYFIDQALGSRAFVASKDRSIHLTPITRIGTLVHEFGHVMGLPDQYYEVWDAQACTYTTEYNRANLMSESSRGAVLQEHFDRLKKLY